MRRRLPDFLIVALLFILPLIMFWQQTLGGKTLLPTENLYQYEPYATYREEAGAPEIPHNHLLSDLVLQNYQWKSFIRSNIDAGEIPLWNPHQFSGIPFMAAGQQSTLYPLSVVYYVLPLPTAYGWFTVLNLWLAGAFMYAFMRGIGVSRVGGVVTGITYQLCGFFLASVLFPMIIGAVVWIPLLLLMAEYVIRRKPLFGKATTAPWIAIGAFALAFSILAGHIEMTIYTILMLGFYSGMRVLWSWWDNRQESGSLSTFFASTGWLGLMVALGFGLGAIQFIPLFEFANTNHRAQRTDFREVLSFAHPPRDVLQFVLPNVYGSPATHSYIDVFTGDTISEFTNLYGTPINYIDWGVKNYVESALYLGILPLALAGFALFHALWIKRGAKYRYRQQHIIFGVLALLSLTFMFGLPTYIIVYVLPGINQLNSAFRWIFGVTVGVTILAGFGADALYTAYQDENTRKWVRRFGYALGFGGITILGGLLISRFAFDQLESLFQRIVESMVKADQAFSDGRMFYNFQFKNVLILGVVTLLSGAVFWLASRKNASQQPKALPLWIMLAVPLIIVDLMIATWGFNPASNPDLLDYTPPVIEWLVEREAEEDAFRYVTLDAPADGHDGMLWANMTMRYGLDDIRGYDSIISLQYVNYMHETYFQGGLDHNRISPLYLDRVQADQVDWNRLDWLNVRYLVTHNEVVLPENVTTALDGDVPHFEVVHETDAARVYRNNQAVPRVQVIDANQPLAFDVTIADSIPATITRDTGRERFIDIDLGDAPDYVLVASETYSDGWRAFIRLQGAGEDLERPLDVALVLDNFQSVALNISDISELYTDIELTSEQQTALDEGLFTIRMVYSPTSFQVGMFGTIISGALIMFLVGIWLWQTVIMPDKGVDTAISRVARNSIAPIILNLFNRGIDFVFAFVMLRILGPTEAGVYFYAVVIFVWFDIFTNFGLDVFLIREASRTRDRAGHFFLNTTYLRLGLIVACIPLVIGFLFIRQATIEPALTSSALIAIGLLYIGLAPGSLNKGLTSLYYGFEKAEYPAAVTTVSTINKAIFGLVALLLGYGIVGLAMVSIFVNIITLGILLYGAREMIGKISKRQPDRKLMRGMVNESWALMLNHFLATVFFQIDVVILEAIKGARVVGLYSVAYKWLQAINIIPAFFTQAIIARYVSPCQ